MPFHRDIQTLLAPTGEARALMLLLMEQVAGLSTAQVLAGEDDELPIEKQTQIRQCAQRVAAGEPIQYVVGTADFCGLPIGVKPGVLIPRPETEELVRWCAETIKDGEDTGGKQDKMIKVLDLCTGSGCIALALKHQFPEADIHALDVSTDALRIARANAQRLNFAVHFWQADVLDFPDALLAPEAPLAPASSFSLLVSNPPYVLASEASEMAPNVLAHEPHLALFVPDDDPLRFYRAIAHLGQRLLQPGGHLLFELNPRFTNAAANLLQSLGYTDVEIRNDPFDKSRLLKATWNDNERK